MANRIFGCQMTLGKSRVIISGSFQPNGANTAVLGKKGVGFTVNHAAAANTYTITLDDTYFDYDSVSVQLQSATLGVEAQVVAEPTVTTTRQIVLGVFDSASKAAVNDLAFNANTRVHFQAILKNTSLGY